MATGDTKVGYSTTFSGVEPGDAPVVDRAIAMHDARAAEALRDFVVTGPSERKMLFSRFGGGVMIVTTTRAWRTELSMAFRVAPFQRQLVRERSAK